MFRYPADGGRPFVWAHRGASASAPENTLAAFLLAAQHGADGVELDVHVTRDGVLAVVHDAWVSQSIRPVRARSGPAQGEGLAPRSDGAYVADMRWADLRRFVRGHDADGRAQHVPRLEEVLESLGPRLAVDIEIKAAPHPWPDLCYPGVIEEVAAVVRRYRFEDRAVVSSFDHRLLRRFAALVPDIASLAIYHARVVDAPALAACVPTHHLNMDVRCTTADDLRACHEAELFVTVGGAEGPSDYDLAASWGADAVTLDDPRWAHPGA